MDRNSDKAPELSNQQVAEKIVQRVWDRINQPRQDTPRHDPTAHLSNQQVAEKIVRRFVDWVKTKTQDHAAQRPGAENSLDAGNYARSVIDTAQSQSDTPNRVVASHAADAQKHGVATAMDAAKLANAAIKQYESYREKGMDHDGAREKVAQEIGSRFDDRGRDTQQQARQQSQGQSL